MNLFRIVCPQFKLQTLTRPAFACNKGIVSLALLQLMSARMAGTSWPTSDILSLAGCWTQSWNQFFQQIPRLASLHTGKICDAASTMVGSRQQCCERRSFRWRFSKRRRDQSRQRVDRSDERCCSCSPSYSVILGQRSGGSCPLQQSSRNRSPLLVDLKTNSAAAVQVLLFFLKIH